jgi:hypothetical protein
MHQRWVVLAIVPAVAIVDCASPTPTPASVNTPTPLGQVIATVPAPPFDPVVDLQLRDPSEGPLPWQQPSCSGAGSLSGGTEYQAQVTPATEQVWLYSEGLTAIGAPPVQRQYKLLWRATGSGDLLIYADGPSGRQIQPSQGPISHFRGTAQWGRPGSEWGSGWDFPVPGCWWFHIYRKSVAARLPITVP